MHYKQFVYAKHFTVRNDHAPLEQILKKPLSESPARLQRMLALLEGFNFTMHYKKGINMHVPDCLSRCIHPPSPRQQPVIPSTSNIHVFEVLCVDENSVDKTLLQMIKDTHSSDELCKTIKHQIHQGWPQEKNQLLDERLLSLYNSRFDLHIVDGYIMYKNQLYVPTQLRKKALEILHTIHQGINNTTKRAQQFLYWPNMSTHINQFIANCDKCQEYNRKPNAKYEHFHISSTSPMQILGADIFHFEGKTYHLLIDYFTSYPWIKEIPKMDVKHIINHFEDVTSLFGYPTVCISDSGTQYTSDEFQRWCTEHGVLHQPATPHSQWQNGKVERCIQSLKGYARKSNLPLNSIVKHIRDTPTETNLSPYTMMFGRQVKTALIPTIQFAPSHPTVPIRNEAPYTPAAPTATLQPGQDIWFKRDPLRKFWSPGKVIDVPGTTAVQVEDRNGNIYRRNAQHVKDQSNAPAKAIAALKQASKPEAKEPADTTRNKAPINKETPQNSIAHSRPKRESKPPIRFDPSAVKFGYNK